MAGSPPSLTLSSISKRIVRTLVHFQLSCFSPAFFAARVYAEQGLPQRNFYWREKASSTWWSQKNMCSSLRWACSDQTLAYDEIRPGVDEVFSDKMAKGRVPDREYFFNVLNTFQGEYLQRLIRHASDQRNESQSMAKAKETIEITDDWWNILNSVSFVSCKSKMLW